MMMKALVVRLILNYLFQKYVLSKRSDSIKSLLLGRSGIIKSSLLLTKDASSKKGSSIEDPFLLLYVNYQRY